MNYKILHFSLLENRRKKISRCEEIIMGKESTKLKSCLSFSKLKKLSKTAKENHFKIIYRLLQTECTTSKEEKAFIRNVARLTNF